jgi:glycosyltransferase involved in cell wall biosynthesis
MAILMSTPLINILIRTSNRPAAFARCIESIKAQSYNRINAIIGYDNPAALDYISDSLERVYVKADKALPYFYDLYCNELKRKVKDGWFFFLDDDDTLASPTILQQLSEHLTSPHEAIICQFLRNGVPKPRDNYIRNKVIAEGKVGLPCLVLHSKHKALSGLDGQKAGDYRYIKEVVNQVPTKFIALPLVDAGARGHGNMENIKNSERIEN